MTAREAAEGRFRAAWVNGGPAAATPRGSGRYVVVGRDGKTRYTAHVVTRERVACDCPAGMHGKPCWHAAAALLRDVADSMIGGAA